MSGLLLLTLLAGMFCAGRVWQWRQDRHARKVAQVMHAAYDAVSDIAAKRQQAEDSIRTQQNRKR